MKKQDNEKQIEINGKTFQLDSVFTDYRTQNIIVTAYESKSDGIGIRLALNWDHYWEYVQSKELNTYYIVIPLGDTGITQEIPETANQEQYYRELDDKYIAGHIYQYFTDPIEEALYCTI